MNRPVRGPMADVARCFALVPCGGTGSRAGAGLPKQYRVVAGRPVLAHTLAALAAVPAVAGVMVVVAPDDCLIDGPHAGLPRSWTEVVGGTPLFIAKDGGSTRAHTVFNGLKALREQGARDEDWVLVHDAARCLVRPAQVAALVAHCQHTGQGGLLALKLPDTLKVEAQGQVVGTVPRDDKWLAQTPQMFRLAELQAALAAAAPHDFAGITDEASAIEAQGGRPWLVAGSAQNIKLTYPEDFELADALLRSRTA